MLLKKQTVWLLTMLSLVVVLTVYYVTLEPPKEQLTTGEEENGELGTDQSAKGTEEESGASVISSVSSQAIFEELRLKLDENRSRLKDELTAIMASTNISTNERAKAYDDIQNLNDVEQKEAVLETLIVAMGYDDALVRAEGEKVLITVKSDEPSATAANAIIKMVKNELGQLQGVAVEFQPNK